MKNLSFYIMLFVIFSYLTFSTYLDYKSKMLKIKTDAKIQKLQIATNEERNILLLKIYKRIEK